MSRARVLSDLSLSSRRKRAAWSQQPARLRLETLEDRTAPALATTTVIAPSIGQAINASTTLNVASTTGFPTGSTVPGYAIVRSPGGNAFIQYGGVSATTFTGVSVQEGSHTVQLAATSTVNQSAQTTSTNATSIPVTSPSIPADTTNFPPSGFLYILSANGPSLVRYGSLTPTSFENCTAIAGTVGTMPIGTNIIESVGPTPPVSGQTNSTMPAGTSVNVATINVNSTFGFADASPTNPGFLVIYALNSTALVQYTGRTATSFTGCTALTDDTDTMAANAVITASASTPIKYTFTNNARLDAPIFTAMFGQDPVGTNGFFAPTDPTKPLDGQTMKFVAYTPAMNGGNVPNYMLFSPGGSVSTTVYFPNNPTARIDSARIYFSVGQKVVIPIIGQSSSAPAPGNPTDPNNKIIYDFVEFTERSSPNDGTLFINTTQVDAVGIPFLMDISPPDSVKTNGVGVTVPRNQLANAFNSYLTSQLGTSNPTLVTAFQALLSPQRLLAPSDLLSLGTSSVLPTMRAYFNSALTAFFTKYLPTTPGFVPLTVTANNLTFSGHTVTGHKPTPYQYTATTSGTTMTIPQPAGNTLPAVLSVGQGVSGPGIAAGTTITAVTLGASNTTTVTLSQAVTSPATSQPFTFTVPGEFTVMKFTGGGTTYYMYAPFFSSNGGYPANFPNSTGGVAPAAPPWIINSTESPGQMVFGNDGVFGDGNFQAAAGQLQPGDNGDTLKDIENPVVSAFNRGVANMPASTWNTASSFYPVAAADGSNWSNYYAGFLHNGTYNGELVSVPIPGTNVGAAYGFAYDDQGNNSPTLATPQPRTVSITFTPWAATALVFLREPQTTPAGRPITATLRSGVANLTLSLQFLRLDAKGFATPAGAPRVIRTNRLGVVNISVLPPGAGTFILQVNTANGGRFAVTQSFTVQPGSRPQPAARPNRSSRPAPVVAPTAASFLGRLPSALQAAVQGLLLQLNRRIGGF